MHLDLLKFLNIQDYRKFEGVACWPSACQEIVQLLRDGWVQASSKPTEIKGYAEKSETSMHGKRVRKVSELFDREIQFHFVTLCFPAAFFSLIVAYIFLKDRHNRKL
jgi:hypothetical protein